MTTAIATPLRRLERRPEAVSFSIEDLLTDVLGGRVRLPRFQRGLRWEDEDRIKLFDSIYRGFPIGTLLFWKRPAGADRLHVGSLTIDAEARTDALWVVDGQQRIVTLAEALARTRHDPGKRSLHFDLEGTIFAFGTDTNKPPPRWLPLSQVLDSARLLDWADRHGLRHSGLLGSALEMGKRLREYQIPAYVVETEDESVLRQVFDRSNSTGKALEAAEVFDALHGSQAAEEPSTLRAIAESLGGLGFGRVEVKYVLRALLAVRRKDPGRGFRQLEPGEISAALAETAPALRQAVVFVKTQAGFPHYALLPYKLPLATLSLFFHEHPEPSPRTRTLLVRWLWRGAINGSHRGDTVALRTTLEAIVPGDEARSIQNLLKGVGPRPNEPGAIFPFNFRHAQSKLQLVALAALGPRDLRTGEHLDVAKLCDSPAGPVVRLEGIGSSLGLEGGLAGRFLHPPVSSGQLRGLLSQSANVRILASHLVSEQAGDALRRADLDTFILLRHSDLDRYVANFLERRAEWAAADRDRPALATLVVEDA
jgi:hypothetical protein